MSMQSMSSFTEEISITLYTGKGNNNSIVDLHHWKCITTIEKRELSEYYLTFTTSDKATAIYIF